MLTQVIAEAGLPVSVPVVGPLLGLFFNEAPPTDFATAKASDAKAYAGWSRVQAAERPDQDRCDRADGGFDGADHIAGIENAERLDRIRVATARRLNGKFMVGGIPLQGKSDGMKQSLTT